MKTYRNVKHQVGLDSDDDRYVSRLMRFHPVRTVAAKIVEGSPPNLSPRGAWGAEASHIGGSGGHPRAGTVDESACRPGS